MSFWLVYNTIDQLLNCTTPTIDIKLQLLPSTDVFKTLTNWWAIAKSPPTQTRCCIPNQITEQPFYKLNDWIENCPPIGWRILFSPPQLPNCICKMHQPGHQLAKEMASLLWTHAQLHLSLSFFTLWNTINWNAKELHINCMMWRMSRLNGSHLEQ